MKKVKMGIVGAGVWGETHASIYHEHILAELVAICDKEEEKAIAIAEKYNIPEVYTDYLEMAQKSTCEAVAVVTPDFLHADVACAFAQEGKHMLIEKPLATTREDIAQIVEAVERSGVRCMVDLHNRWSTAFNLAKQRIDAGNIGEPYTAYIRHSDIKWVATDMLSWAASSSILWFLGSHSLDALRWFFDDEIKQVYSVKRTGVLKSMGIDTADVYLTTIEFENGGVAHMENGWITPNGNGNVNDFRCSVMGTKGQININASNHNLIQIATEDRMEVPDIMVTNMVFDKCKGLSYESIRDFVDRIADGKPFRVTLEDARRCALAIIAIHESADKEKIVKVEYT